MKSQAVVLVSGGLDSATALAIARADGFAVRALSFRYGQRHQVELEAARAVCDLAGVLEHRIIDMDLRQFGGSALTDELAVPKERSAEEMSASIPITYVPARNTIFLSYALAWSEVLGVSDIYIGVNALDYSGYPDCRPEYMAAFERLANLATKGAVTGSCPVRLHAPLIHWTKAQIIARGLALGVEYSHTISCYDPDETGRACGACAACQLRRRGFAELGVADPTRYQQHA